MTVDAARGAEDKLLQHGPWLLLRTCRKGRGDANGYKESVKPRTSITPAPPDRVRHAHCLCWQSPPSPAGPSRARPRIARLYSQAESRRKSPDRERRHATEATSRRLRFRV